MCSPAPPRPSLPVTDVAALAHGEAVASERRPCPIYAPTPPRQSPVVLEEPSSSMMMVSVPANLCRRTPADKFSSYSDDESQHTLQGGGQSPDMEESDPSNNVRSEDASSCDNSKTDKVFFTSLKNMISMYVKEKFAHKGFQREKGK
ncbi:hypothetical protein E2562_002260, partial [Oryza meyeriana var. granulata]